MDNYDLRKLIDEIYAYFDRKTLPTPDQVELWQRELSYIENEAVDGILHYLKKRDNLLGNFPNHVKKAYALHSKTNPALIVYDKEEDLRFPIGKLWTAFRILESKGEIEFIEYCEAENMPINDRERVLNKFKKIYGDLHDPSYWDDDNFKKNQFTQNIGHDLPF